MDAARHPALLMVDTISSLGSVPYHDAWGVDDGQRFAERPMLPPGLGFNAISNKALLSKSNGLARSYWDWQLMTLITNQVISLHPSNQPVVRIAGITTMLSEEGLDSLLRHDRMAAATRRAVQAPEACVTILMSTPAC